MRKLSWLTITVLLIPGLAAADGECMQCLKEKFEKLPESTVVNSALGALGGAAAGAGLPGAVCGAVLAAVGTGINTLVEATKCQTICDKEAKKRKDPDPKKCEDMMLKAKGG